MLFYLLMEACTRLHTVSTTEITVISYDFKFSAFINCIKW